tara:strand:- start:25 stop:150 length:126 start_codon:yes stop_codon:yes gene_type:complete
MGREFIFQAGIGESQEAWMEDVQQRWQALQHVCIEDSAKGE